MKNLIDPKVLAELKQEPVSFARIASFLESNHEITAAKLCKLLDIEPQPFYNWKNRMAKRALSVNDGDIDVVPTGADKKYYSASDKLKLIKRFANVEGENRVELMRKYGLYESDFARWQKTVDEVALEALSTRKPRSDKKSVEQLEVDRLKAELRGQEKTIAKLSAIVVAQKKISDLLKDDESD
jgi:hypothetical protein